MSVEDKPLGSCCSRLLEELNKPYDHRYFFERDGMLAMTAGYTEPTETQGGHWTRMFAHYCPFCATPIMPESARLKAN
jgi:hypothetical protein